MTPSSSDLSQFLASGAVLATAQGGLWLGFGEFERSASPPPGRLSFFAPDFFLRDPAPWWTPAFALETDNDELKRLLAGHEASAPPVWSGPDRAQWDAAFGLVRARLGTGLRKAVPVLFERALVEVTPSTRGAWLRSLLAVGGPVQPYGLWTRGEGILGATPETLFSSLSLSRVSTMALAGTRARTPVAMVWDDPKEIHEHDLVVSDIERALSPFGQLHKASRRILSLSVLEHWQTPIELELTNPFDFSELASALHPTAALGVFPREGGWHWLEELPGGARRARFGAPFGALSPDGRAHCVVAIRNLQWRGDECSLGAGCGVVEASDRDREWNELALKRLSVKKMFSL